MMNSDLQNFLKGCHPDTKLLSIGEVNYLDFKDKPVKQPAILCRGAVYGQVWAWAVGKGGKVSSVHSDFFTEIV